MVTVHVVDFVVQAPDQLENLDPALGVAVKVTVVPATKSALHFVPQLMPLGWLVTTPDPETLALSG